MSGKHEAVAYGSWVDYYGRTRRSVTCSCGKRYTGFGTRSWYSFETHVKKTKEN